MKNYQPWLKRITQLGLLLMMGISMSAIAGWFGFGGDSWKEEVLLHDGGKIVVERSVEHGGRHELFKDSPISEQRLTWTMPGTQQTMTWEEYYSKDVGSANFMPMLVDVYQGAAYLVADTMGCLAYNKWGRPNPPYVIFKNQGKEWKRIPLQELPAEIKTPNMIFSNPDGEVKKIGKRFITADMIQKITNGYFQPEFRTILREPIKSGGKTSCEELYPDGKGGWLGVGWFKHTTQQECAKFCVRENISAEFCKCIISKQGE